MYLESTAKDARDKVVYNKEHSHNITAGATLAYDDLNTITEVQRGTVVNIDETTAIARVVKSVEVMAGGTTTIPRVKKGHEFKVGDFVFRTVGGLAVTINSIDTSNADYDAVTFSAALTGTVAGDVLMQSAAAGASAGAFKYVPNAILTDKYKLKGQPSVSAIIRGFEVIKANLPYPINDTIIAALKEGNRTETFNF